MNRCIAYAKSVMEARSLLSTLAAGPIVMPCELTAQASVKGRPSADVVAMIIDHW